MPGIRREFDLCMTSFVKKIHTMSFVFDFSSEMFLSDRSISHAVDSIFENKFILGEGGRFDRNTRS